MTGDPALLDQNDQLDPGIVGPADLPHEPGIVGGIGEVGRQLLKARLPVYDQRPAIKHIIANVQFFHPVGYSVPLEVVFQMPVTAAGMRPMPP